MILKWKDEYCIGVDLVDSQHEHLFDIGNKAYQLLRSDIYIDKYNKIIEIIEELKDYTVFHFHTEEEYMKKINYNKFLSHKVEHDDFVKKINSVDLETIDEDQDKYIEDLLKFVFDWILNHILLNDKKISSVEENK